MPTYADRDDIEAYIEGWVTDDPAALDRLIERAERDVDLLLAGPVPLDSATGLKLDPDDLSDPDRRALTDAVCAQVEWRLTAPGAEDGRVTGAAAQAIKSVKGPDFSKEYDTTGAAGRARRYGPKVADELGRIPHLRSLGGRAVA